MVQVATQMSKLVTKILLPSLLLSFLLFSSSCATTAKQKNVISKLSVGSGTDRGNEVQVIELLFDNKWRSAKGNMSCCWGDGGGQTHYNASAPKKLNVSWFDYEPERIFRAEITLSENLFKSTQDLPSYYLVRQKQEVNDIRPQLIVGLGSSGEVVVWISNSTYGGNHLTGRVMHEVGRGQAICLPSINEGVPDNCKNLANEPKIQRPF